VACDFNSSSGIKEEFLPASLFSRIDFNGENSIGSSGSRLKRGPWLLTILFCVLFLMLLFDNFLFSLTRSLEFRLIFLKISFPPTGRNSNWLISNFRGGLELSRKMLAGSVRTLIDVVAF